MCPINSYIPRMIRLLTLLDPQCVCVVSAPTNAQRDVRSDAADSASDVSFEECVKLAQELKEVSRLPVSCRQYLDKKAVLHQACEGMTGDQVRQTQYSIRRFF